MKRLVCAVLLTLFPLVLSLYEDQIGSYDWHQRFVGAVSHISIDQTAKSSRGVVVSSEGGVLAVLNPRDGSIRWRQVYEQGPNGAIDVVLRNKFGSLVTVSRGGQLLRSWDLSSGLLKYEVLTSLSPPPQRENFPLDKTWRPGGVLASLTGKNGAVTVVASGAEISGYVTRTAEQKWTYSLKSDSVVGALYGGRDGVHVLSVGQNEMGMILLNASTGKVVSFPVLQAPWINTNSSSCILSGDRVFCVDWLEMELHSAPLGNSPSFRTSPLQSLLQLTTPTPMTLLPASGSDEVWLSMGHSHWLLHLQEEGLSVGSRIDVGLPLVGVVDVTGSSDGQRVDMRLVAGKQDLTLLYYQNGKKKVGGVYRITNERGNPKQAALQLYTQADQSVMVRVAVVMEDDSIIMFGADTKKQCVREDGLGTTVGVEFLDLPADQSAMIESFLDRSRSEANPIKLAFLRWQLQVQLFKESLNMLQQGDLVSLLQADNSKLTRDQFNTRKMILAITASGKIYGMDSRNGTVVWQLFFPWLLPLDKGSLLLYILRSTSHPLHPPLAVLIGTSKHPSCPHLALLPFNPLTGIPDQEGLTCLPQLLQVLHLTSEDRTHLKSLLFLTKDLKVTSYPVSPDVTSHLTQLKQEMFFYVVDKEAGHVNGYYVDNERTPLSEDVSLLASHLWHITFPSEAERIVGVVSKAPNEHVSAVGRSRVDRSIQYKYLNPNLVAIITESTDHLRPAISVYLVDVVTGGVIFHTTHKAAIAPVHLIHSENWIVYQFLNSKQRRHELVVVELFERDSNTTHSIWSSLTPPPPPETLTQAYAIPTSFVTMATTQTRRGITTKSILVGLKSGHVGAIPKTILDPRREVEPTDEMKEAGLPPYVPEMGISPLIYINYNQTVAGLKNIYSVASGLESTSLVLACGLDLHFTRVLPSKQFDLLAVDFDYTLIVGVLLSMVIGTIVLSWLSARKSLNLLWK